MSWKYPGILSGSTTVSSNNLLAFVNPATSFLHDGGNISVMWQFLLNYTQKHHTQTDKQTYVHFKVKSLAAAKYM